MTFARGSQGLGEHFPAKLKPRQSIPKNRRPLLLPRCDSVSPQLEMCASKGNAAQNSLWQVRNFRGTL